MLGICDGSVRIKQRVPSKNQRDHPTRVECTYPPATVQYSAAFNSRIRRYFDNPEHYKTSRQHHVLQSDIAQDRPASDHQQSHISAGTVVTALCPRTQAMLRRQLPRRMSKQPGKHQIDQSKVPCQCEPQVHTCATFGLGRMARCDRRRSTRQSDKLAIHQTRATSSLSLKPVHDLESGHVRTIG